jgi:hypothetical protein
MKYILFIILVSSNNETSITTQEFDSLAACEAASTRVVDEIRKTPEYSIGPDASRAYCVEKG